jgi:hypothetical protein
MRVSIDDVILQAEAAFQYAKTNSVCTGFDEFILPPGCEPPTSKLAFDWRGDARLLMLQPGIRYSGTHAAFHDFAQSGIFRGNNAEAVTAFLQDIKGTYGGAPAPSTPIDALIDSPQSPAVPPPELPPQPSSPRLDDIVDTSEVTLDPPEPPKLDTEATLAGFKDKVFGQDRSLETLVSRVGNHVGKQNPARPLSLLIAGPPGVGKTSVAQLLPKLLTEHGGREWGYICVNANQMGEKHTISHLLGAPPGYIGHDSTPLLSPVAKNPYHVLLFDEIEKADPEFLTVLMSAMSDGRMQAFKEIEGKREINVARCVLVFTTNLPLHVSDPDRKSAAEITKECREQLMRPMGGRPGILPEIVARFTEVLLFDALTDQDKVKILARTIIFTAEQYGLCIKRISTGLLQSVVDTLTVENGAREPQYAMDDLLGKPLTDFACEHKGVTDISLSGTTEHIEVIPYAN